MKHAAYAILGMMILFSTPKTVMSNDASMLVKAVLWPVFLPIEVVKTIKTASEKKGPKVKTSNVYKFLVMCRDVDRKVAILYFGPANASETNGVRFVITPSYISGPQKFIYQQSINPRQKKINEEEFAEDFFRKKVTPTTSQYDLVTVGSNSRLSIEYSHDVTGVKLLHQSKMIGRDRGQIKMICTFDSLPINEFMTVNPMGEGDTTAMQGMEHSRNNLESTDKDQVPPAPVSLSTLAKSEVKTR